MRGKLRDKRDVKRDRLKREVAARKPSKRDNRNLHLLLQMNESDDFVLESEDELIIEKEQSN